MSTSSRPTFSKRQRELDQKDRVAERAARREDRKSRAADRAAAGRVGPPMGEPIAPPRNDLVSATDMPSPSRDPIAGNRLYVGNLSYTTDTEALRALFATKGTVSDVHVVMDRDSGRPRGFAFVTMATSADAQKAIADLDGAVLDDRPLRVDQAEARQARGGGRDRS